jgi:predicted alpha/beta hydrolase family esterase
LIHGVNFLEQLHFEIFPATERRDLGGATASDGASSAPPNLRLLVACHGYSPENGPSYAFFSALVSMISKLKGWSIAVPDFRTSYAFGAARGRSERLRLIQEEILVQVAAMGSLPSSVVLVGHSQGGAACAQLCCSDRLVEALKIGGLVMLGSESPMERLPPPEGLSELDDGDIIIHATRPSRLTPDNIHIIHSRRDQVVGEHVVQSLAAAWGVRCRVLKSDVLPDNTGCEWAADVQHDFIALDLLFDVFLEIKRILEGTVL